MSLTPSDILNAFQSKDQQWQRYCMAMLGLAYMKSVGSGMELITVGPKAGQSLLAMVLATSDSATEILKMGEKIKAELAVKP